MDCFMLDRGKKGLDDTMITVDDSGGDRWQRWCGVVHGGGTMVVVFIGKGKESNNVTLRCQ